MDAAIRLDKTRIREMRLRYVQSHCDICARHLHLLHDVVALVDVDKGRVRCLKCALNPANDNH